MPQRTSNNKETTPPIVILRRSPRFHQTAKLEDPKTPNPERHRRTRSLSSATPLSFTGNKKVSFNRRSHRSGSKQCLQKVDESCDEDKLPGGSDRRNGKLEKRITRSSYCRDLDNTSHCCASGEWMLEEGATISKQFKGKSIKNTVKPSKKDCDNDSNQFDPLALSKTPIFYEVSKKDSDRITVGLAVATAVVVRERPVNVRDDVNKREKNISVKRKRNQFEYTMGITQGWTKDQELALERAYLEAKPTPHFWKKVSRLVPGKSAQECFDKIHCSHLTPPQPRVRSRARVSNSQDPSLSASKLLETSSPTTKRPRIRKQKSHIVQRTVRHMLQNQYKPEHDSESDLFSLLEPTFNSSVNLNMILTTPDRNQETDDTHKRSSTIRRSVSRFSSLNATTLVSPPVLKQVKNKVLHEKYIDLLNCREANRKAASAKAAKAGKSKVMKLDGSAERKEAVKAAKNALVFGAKDAINDFQHKQATTLNDLFDYESGGDADEDKDQVF